MPRGISVSKWIICDIRVAVQVLRIGIPWHNRIRAQKVVNIRRTGPAQQFARKAGGMAPSLRRAPPHRQPLR